MTEQASIEQVWGLPRGVLFEILAPFQGFLPVDALPESFSSAAGSGNQPPLESVGALLDEAGSFRPRPDVESDPTWKQIIPYVMLRCDDRVLLLERLSTQGEKRLHNLFSIGVGGHVNPESPGPDPLLVRGLRREVREELEIDQVPEPRFLGFINDDSTAVGSVHFGVACELEVASPVQVRERDKMRGRWVGPQELREHHPGMETWSQLLVDCVFPSKSS